MEEIYLLRVKSNGYNKAEVVQPIKNMEDINLIKHYFLKQENKRNYTLFVVGINVGLRMGDLLKLKIGDVINERGDVNSRIVLNEQKTNKVRTVVLNNSAKDSIYLYLQSLNDFNRKDYLFSSRKGKKPLRVDSVHKIIKTAFRVCEIPGNYGTHSLRKTWAYHLYMNNSENKMILPMIQTMLNHSSLSTTLRYLGLEQEEMDRLYSNLNL